MQEILTILREETVHPSAWIWVHAHHVQDPQQVTTAAERGAWISFDGINENSAPHVLDLVKAMQERGYLDQLLLSHDGDSYFGDGESRPYHHIFTDFIPTLEKHGFTAQDIHRLTVDNPCRAFVVGVKNLQS